MSRNAVRPKLVLPRRRRLPWCPDVPEARVDARYQAGEQVVFAELAVLGTPVTSRTRTSSTRADPGGGVVFPVADQPCGAREADARATRSESSGWCGTPLTLTADEVQSSLDRTSWARLSHPGWGRRRHGA
jgi:hypothetical protein